MSKRLLDDEKDDQIKGDEKRPTKRRRKETTNANTMAMTSIALATVNKQPRNTSNKQMLRLHLLSCGYIRCYDYENKGM